MTLGKKPNNVDEGFTMERYYDIDGNFAFECEKLNNYIFEINNAKFEEYLTKVRNIAQNDGIISEDDNESDALIQMQRIDFSKKSMDGIHAENVDFSNSSFEQSCLYWGSFDRCKFDGVNFRDCDLRGVIFFDCTFEDCDFSGADLGFSNVGTGADVCGADLSTAIFNETNLIGIEYDDTTIWPKGFKPPKSVNERLLTHHIKECQMMTKEEKSLFIAYGKVRNRNPAFWPDDVPKPNTNETK